MRRELVWQFRRVTRRWPHRCKEVVRGNATGRLVGQRVTRPDTALVTVRGRSTPKVVGGSQCRGYAAARKGTSLHSRRTRGGLQNSLGECCVPLSQAQALPKAIAGGGERNDADDRRLA